MGIIAVAANLLFFGLLLSVEALISRLGWIPKRQSHHDPERPQESFLYLRDRNIFRIGDIIGLSILAFAIGAIIDQKGFPPLWYIIVAALLGAAYTARLHHTEWMVQRKRDSAYPPGGISLLGILHLPYHAGHSAWILMGAWHILDLSILSLILLGVLGGGIWWVAVVQDGKMKRHL
ncbi:hypothetical protein IID24_05400 [Patescibacteria group bacterium]|nr:hypothetical protein [Patescibacteria group bacterium]